MKKSVIFLFAAILVFMLSGCILSKTPTTNDVAMPFGDPMTFSVNVFPPPTSFAWTLDGEPLVNAGNSYAYTARAGDHVLTVQATHFLGTDTQTWNIQTPVSEPITDLLNSMVSIPAGSFMMGSTDNEYEWAQFTTPVHQVTLQAFDIGAYEVTQAQYLAVMGTNSSYFQGTSYPNSENNPVEQVSWYDARAFCTALSALTGRTFTLPSEAQWDYACRAGTTTLYSFGDSDALLSDYAWWGTPSGSTQPIGTKLPNPWGLYDIHGNVWEWCLDFWHENYTGAPTDGSAWETDTGSGSVIRGGGWYNVSPGYFRSAARPGSYGPGSGYPHIGFRVVSIPAS
jgi:formylglycine-generating enzyme required for sulfatase activity